MKINLPVAGQERLFPDGLSLISRTDTKGIITYVSDLFVEVSGYSREELIGSSHNIVRHPDVPAAVFEEMWHCLKQGLPWEGIVKNRCKNGDYYWNNGIVVPVRKNGETIGYMSACGAPTRQEVAAAELSYKRTARSGRVFQYFSNSLKDYISIKNILVIGILLILSMMVAGSIIGVSGLKFSNEAIRSLYHEELEPVRAIGRISFLIADNRARVALALQQDHGHTAEADHLHLANHIELLDKNKNEIDELLEIYNRQSSEKAERELFDKFEHARSRYLTEGLLPAKQALQSGDYAAAERFLREAVNPLYLEVNYLAEDLLDFHLVRAANKSFSVADHNDRIASIAVGVVSFFIMVIVLSGFFFFRGTVIPLEKAVQALERIAEGDLSGNTYLRGYGEPGRVMAAVKVMQLHLKVMMDEVEHSSVAIHRQGQNLNHTVMNIAQHSEEQHDRVSKALDEITNSCKKITKLAQNAAGLASAAENSEKMTGLILTETMPRGDGQGVSPDAQMADENNVASADAVIMSSHELTNMARELAGISITESFYLEDAVSQMMQVASLIAANVIETQSAGAVSQQLVLAARELDELVKYFK